MVQAGDQQTGRPVQQLLTQQLLFLAFVVMRHAHQGLKATGAQSLLGSVKQIYKQVIGKLGYQHGHMVAALRGQGPGGRVGHITQLGRSGQHPLDQRRIDRSFTAQSPRHRDRADAGGVGYVIERDAAGGAVVFGRRWHVSQG